MSFDIVVDADAGVVRDQRAVGNRKIEAHEW
jgi:hypothetical protein